jgi:hypothetical protein
LKSIILVRDDGTRDLAFVVCLDFDTRSWANARLKAFKRRGVVQVIEQTTLH